MSLKSVSEEYVHVFSALCLSEMLEETHFLLLLSSMFFSALPQATTGSVRCSSPFWHVSLPVAAARREDAGGEGERGCVDVVNVVGSKPPGGQV